MTEVNHLSPGAPSTLQDWQSIQWKEIEATVRRLQRRIAKAYREKKYGKVKSLQWLLTHSYHAKLLAVRRVTQNRGAKTPGVDQVTWKTPAEKGQAAKSLKRRGYKTQPLRRIYIPKKQTGKKRPLSIPTMGCRAMQALYLLALEPVSEMIADPHAYGFRPRRSTADAIARCHNALCRPTAARYILEADIKGCFDNISHPWLLENVPMDKQVLAKWLEAGYVDGNEIFPTERGTPQGGIISPCLLVITLSELEKAVLSASSNLKRDKVHLSVYADDFIVTGATEAVLTNKVYPKVEEFLGERGLSLSKEKTKITHIKDGFDFLGVNIRRYDCGKVMCKPSKANVKALLADLRNTTKRYAAAKTEDLIYALNPKIRGWTNYYCHTCSKRTFQYVDHMLFKAIWAWARRRHNNKGAMWVRRKYFRADSNRDWIFHARAKQKDGTSKIIDLMSAGSVKIKRHVMIKSLANPYDPQFKDYFIRRSWCKTHAPNGAISQKLQVG